MGLEARKEVLKGMMGAMFAMTRKWDSLETQGRCAVHLRIHGGQYDTAWTEKYVHGLEALFEVVDLPLQTTTACPWGHSYGCVLLSSY